MMNWKGVGRKRSSPNFKALSQHLPGGNEGNHEKLSQDSRFPGPDLNPELHKYEGVLTLWDFKLSRRRVWCSELSSGMYCRVKWLSTDVSEVCTASIIRDECPQPRRSFLDFTYYRNNITGKYKLRFALRSFFHPDFTSFLSFPFLLRSLFSNIHSLWSSLSLRDHISDPYQTTGKTTVL
jgi:hypothetical protein